MEELRTKLTSGAGVKVLPEWAPEGRRVWQQGPPACRAVVLGKGEALEALESRGIALT